MCSPLPSNASNFEHDTSTWQPRAGSIGIRRSADFNGMMNSGGSSSVICVSLAVSRPFFGLPPRADVNRAPRRWLPAPLRLNRNHFRFTPDNQTFSARVDMSQTRQTRKSSPLQRAAGRRHWRGIRAAAVLCSSPSSRPALKYGLAARCADRPGTVVRSLEHTL
jgi:hypothetical protein